VGYRLSILSCEIRRKFFSWEDPKRQSLSILSCEIRTSKMPLLWSRNNLSILSCEISRYSSGTGNLFLLNFQFSLARSDVGGRGSLASRGLPFNSLLRDQLKYEIKKKYWLLRLSILSCEISSGIYSPKITYLDLSILSCEISSPADSTSTATSGLSFNSLLRDQEAMTSSFSASNFSFQFSLARSVYLFVHARIYSPQIFQFSLARSADPLLSYFHSLPHLSILSCEISFSMSSKLTTPQMPFNSLLRDQ